MISYHCYHTNGWFQSINLWIFTKRVFCCIDCNLCLDIKQYNKDRADNEDALNLSPYYQDNDGSEYPEQY